MGEAPPPQKELVLCITPFDKPTEVLDNILKKHPNVEFKFIHHTFAPGVTWHKNKVEVPDGMLRCAIPLITRN